MTVQVTGNLTKVSVDKLFCEVVDIRSIVVVSVIPNRAALVGADVFSNGVSCDLWLMLSVPDNAPMPTKLVVTIRGIRKGRTGVRFPAFTEAQMHKNGQFWRSAYENA
jgi:hypothetical protein